MIAEAKEIRENQSYTRAAAIQQANKQLQSQHEAKDDENPGTLKGFLDYGTLVPSKNEKGDLTMIAHSNCNTLVPDSGTMVELQSNLGTMVINSDSEESTMKRHDTNPDKPKYRPLFLEHFDKKEAENNLLCNSNFNNGVKETFQEAPKMEVPAKNTPQQIQQQMQNIPTSVTHESEEQHLQQQRIQSHLDFHLNQIQQSAIQQHVHKMTVATAPTSAEINENLQHQIQQQHLQQQQAENLIKYQRLNALDSDYEFVRILFRYLP
jgi:serine/threonine kinase 3